MAIPTGVSVKNEFSQTIPRRAEHCAFMVAFRGESTSCGFIHFITILQDIHLSFRQFMPNGIQIRVPFQAI